MCECAGQPMNQLPLENLEDLIQESLDPSATCHGLGLPHPLANFAVNGAVKDGPYADAILAFIHDETLEEPLSTRHKAAMWFLFESERAFFVACSEAGIDAEELRSHLLKCKLGELNDQELDDGEQPRSA